MSHATEAILTRCTAQSRHASPLGPLLLARTASGLAGAWFEDQKHHPAEIAAPHDAGDPLLREAAAQLAAFFAGTLGRFTLPLDLHGTAFQRAVWAELLGIAPGTTTTYGAIATRLGVPAASRAVGAAVGRNPVSVIVPCHRVVGSGGALTGYAGGLHRKTRLLAIEAGAALPALH